jgi:hypothetical protein
VDSGAGLDALDNKNLAPAGNRTPAVQPIAGRYTNESVPVLVRSYAIA